MQSRLGRAFAGELAGRVSETERSAFEVNVGLAVNAAGNGARSPEARDGLAFAGRRLEQVVDTEAAAAEAVISRSRIVLWVRDPFLFIAPSDSDSLRAEVECNWKTTVYCEVPGLWE